MTAAREVKSILKINKNLKGLKIQAKLFKIWIKIQSKMK